MDRNIIRILIEVFYVLHKHYGNDVFDVALYIFSRFGTSKFTHYINSQDIENISNAIKQKESLFNEDLNTEIDKISSK